MRRRFKVPPQIRGGNRIVVHHSAFIHVEYRLVGCAPPVSHVRCGIHSYGQTGNDREPVCIDCQGRSARSHGSGDEIDEKGSLNAVIMPEPEAPSFGYERFARKLFKIVDGPVTFFRETVVEPIRGKNQLYYYHRKFRRVPTVDECEVGSQTCLFEANEQFKRDKSVDSEILAILMDRRLECMTYYGTEADKYCQKVQKDQEDAATNWFIKYGDLGPAGNVYDAYVKQKNRLLWERRHGPVGTGMKKREA